MDQLICVSLCHIHYWYEVDTLKVSVDYVHGHTNSKSVDQPGKVANAARGQLNRENKLFPVRVRA